MKRRIAAMLAAGLVLLAGCTPTPQAEEGSRVYFVSHSDGVGRLVYERVAFPADAEGQALCKSVLAAMQIPRAEGNQSALPQGVQVSVSVNGQIATLDFSARPEELSTAQWSLAVSAAALSLLEINDIGYIYIRAGGESVAPFYDWIVSRSSFVTDETVGSGLAQQ